MTDVLTVTLLLIGAGFALLAAVAVVRMPDLFTRMHGATKCATLGVGCIILAVAIAFGDTGTTTRALLIICFLFLTAPIAAHMIGRAAHRLNVPRWHGTIIDESRR
jgi:multicomponent Na+:H+ antiporter subunit G